MFACSLSRISEAISPAWAARYRAFGSTLCQVVISSSVNILDLHRSIFLLVATRRAICSSSACVAFDLKYSAKLGSSVMYAFSFATVYFSNFGMKARKFSSTFSFNLLTGSARHFGTPPARKTKNLKNQFLSSTLI